VPPGGIVRGDADHELADRGCRGRLPWAVALDAAGSHSPTSVRPAAGARRAASPGSRRTALVLFEGHRSAGLERAFALLQAFGAFARLRMMWRTVSSLRIPAGPSPGRQPQIYNRQLEREIQGFSAEEVLRVAMRKAEQVDPAMSARGQKATHQGQAP